MNIIVNDATGRPIGVVKDYSVFNLKGKKVFEAKPKTTFKKIVRILLADLLRYEQ